MTMKNLKFAPELCVQILDGIKTSTWRLFDDKDLQVGDNLSFVNKETLEIFGTAVITALIIKTLGMLDKTDWKGHERFESEEIMYQTYRKYYGDCVNSETEVKLLQFTFTPIT